MTDEIIETNEINDRAEAYERLGQAINAVADALKALDCYGHGGIEFVQAGSVSRCTIRPANDAASGVLTRADLPRALRETQQDGC